MRDPENLLTAREQARIAVATALLRELAPGIETAAEQARSICGSWRRLERGARLSDHDRDLVRRASGLGDYLDLLYVLADELYDASRVGTAGGARDWPPDDGVGSA